MTTAVSVHHHTSQLYHATMLLCSCICYGIYMSSVVNNGMCSVCSFSYLL